MITPQKMSEFEKNKVVDMFSKLNQDLTSSIIKKLQQNEDISSFTKAQMRVLARQGGKEIFNEALNKVNGLSRERKKQLLRLFEELQYKKAKWIRSLAPAVIFIEKEEYAPSFFFGNIKLKVYFY